MAVHDRPASATETNMALAVAAKAKQAQQARVDAMREQSRQHWEALQQADVEQATAQATRQAEQAARDAQMQANREAFANGTLQFGPASIQTYDEYYKEQDAIREAARAQAEAERIAAISPRDRIINALPLPKRQYIDKWSHGHPGEEFPLEALPYI